MRKYLVLILALPILIISTEASAGDTTSEPQYSKATQKLLKQLEAIGVNNKDVVDFVATIKENTQKNSFSFYQQDIPTGHLNFRYQFHVDPIPGTGIKQQHTQLVYTPDFADHTEVVAAKGSVMVNFKLKF